MSLIGGSPFVVTYNCFVAAGAILNYRCFLGLPDNMNSDAQTRQIASCSVANMQSAEVTFTPGWF
jgi:hypothetical protein